MIYAPMGHDWLTSLSALPMWRGGEVTKTYTLSGSDLALLLMLLGVDEEDEGEER